MRFQAQELLADGPGSVFDGIPSEELERLLGRAEPRRFRAGAVILAEGEMPPAVYVIQSGSAGVFLHDEYGRDQLLGRIEAGTTFGEMSLITGDPAAATIRASDELEALVVPKEDFERLAGRYPTMYRNLAGILAERLERTSRLAAEREPGRITVLQDWGAPALLAYAIACSVAWHTRKRALLVALGDEFSEELQRFARVDGDAMLERHERRADAGVDLALAPMDRRFAPPRLSALARELANRYDDVLLLVRGAAALDARRTLNLGDDSEARGEGAVAGVTVRAWTGSGRRRPHTAAGVLEVPPLQPADEAALLEGLLPPTTPAGRALGWLARDLAGLKVGVALGAGSLRGYAHFGALRALERAGVVPDVLAGTSIGAAVASISALGHTATDGITIFDRGASAVFRPTVPIYSALTGRGVR
ncbi:MAG: patatin-like phospholipase domain-containing protein, partial [Actinomycetota bacterium]|nr:patatin-like phospholipase domain-containing protein [Actinomycetota bacterium]